MDKKDFWYCAAPFRSLYLNDGIVSPCCWFDRTKLVNRDQSLLTAKDVFYSPEFDEIRSAMENPGGHAGCTKCRYHEGAGGKSHRSFWNEREGKLWGQLDTNPHLKGLDLDMGNLCNLKCVTCNSHNSTAWISDEKEIFGQAIYNGTKKINPEHFKVEIFQDLSWLKFAGGEVLLMPEHSELLDFLIENKLARNIHLVYIVNNSISPRQFLGKWEEFSSVRIILSIDGIEEFHEYIRFPSKWTENLKIVEAYLDTNFDIEVNSVVSLYNVFHLPVLDQWWKDISGGRDIFYRILNYPVEMSIVNLPKSLKEKAITNLRENKAFEHVVKKLRETLDDKNLKFDEFLELAAKMDDLRGTDLFFLNSDYGFTQKNQ